MHQWCALRKTDTVRPGVSSARCGDIGKSSILDRAVLEPLLQIAEIQ